MKEITLKELYEAGNVLILPNADKIDDCSECPLCITSKNKKKEFGRYVFTHLTCPIWKGEEAYTSEEVPYCTFEREQTIKLINQETIKTYE